MAFTFISPAGTVDSPQSLVPHATTVPSSFSANACEQPASIAFTFVSPDVTFEKYSQPCPHSITVAPLIPFALMFAASLTKLSNM